MARKGFEHEHHERHAPLIEEMRGDIMRSYVDMMARLNSDIAAELKRARGLSKSADGPTLTVHYGGLARTLDSDLYKAGPRQKPKGRRAYDYTDPRTGKQVHVEQTGVPEPEEGPKAPRTKKPEEVKEPRTKKPEEVKQKRGRWYKDEFGNVRFATKPIGRFTEAMSEDEASRLTGDLNLMITQFDPDKVQQLAEFMEVHVDVLSTLREAAGTAAISGISPEEAFIDDYVEAYHDESLQGTFEYRSKEELEKEAAELYANMVEAFREAASSRQFGKYSERLLKKKQLDDMRAVDRMREQKKIVKGHFEELMTGDINTEGIKTLGIAFDLGCIKIPSSLKEAQGYMPSASEDEARQIIGMARVDVDRYNALSGYADSMSIEQQVALAAIAILYDEQSRYDEDHGFDRDAFWEEARDDPGIDGIRDYQAVGGKEFTDEQWDLVRDKVHEVARKMSDSMLAYNNGSDPVFKALFHRQTDLGKLFRGGGGEVGRLKDLQENAQLKRVRAVEAQSKGDHEIDTVVVNGLRETLRGEGVKDWKKADLFSYQKAAVAWMEEIERGILAYDAGLGKTPIAIAYVSNLIKKGKAKRGILILPANLIDQWPKEIERFRPGSKVQIVRGTREERHLILKAINEGKIEADFVLVSSGTVELGDELREELRNIAKVEADAAGKKSASQEMEADIIRDHGLLAKDPVIQELKKLEGALIYDEIHMDGQALKNPHSKKHLIAQDILDGRQHAFGMSATPMTVGPEDLFHQLNLFHPGAAGESLQRFSGRMVKYETQIDPETGKVIRTPVDIDRKDLREAKAAIEPFVFFKRKSAKAVLDEMESKGMKLPKLHGVAVSLSIDEATKEMYDSCGEIGFDADKEPFGGYADDYVSDRDMIARIVERQGHPDVAALIKSSPPYMAAEIAGARVPDALGSIESVMRTRRFIRRQKIAISPKLVDNSYEGPEPKIDHTIEIAKRHFADSDNHDKPLVVFGSFKGSLALMKQRLMEQGVPEHLIGTYHGDVNMRERSAIQDGVNAGKVKILLIGIKAGGAGLNLQKKAFRNVFLDKPWTPAEMEQALGRTWRTGSPADTVYAHHMRIVGTTDDRKYHKLKSRIEVNDALAFADMEDDALSGIVQDSIKNLVGQLDEDAGLSPFESSRMEVLQGKLDSKSIAPKEHEELKALRTKAESSWSPEIEKQALQQAGLHSGDVSPLGSLKVFREDFDRKAFRAAIDLDIHKKYGDSKIRERHVLNELKYKEGLISKTEYQKNKKNISSSARRWMDLMNVGADHPVAQYAGEDFNYRSPGVASVAGGRGGSSKKPRVPKDKQPKSPNGEFPVGVREKQATKPKAPPKKIEIKPKTTFQLKGVSKNPFKNTDPQWTMWEALRKTRPTSYGDAVNKVANWVYEYYRDDPDPYTKAQAKAATKKWFDKKKLLDKFAKMGMIEV